MHLNAGSDLKVGVAYTSWLRSPTHIQQNTAEYCQVWRSGISAGRCTEPSKRLEAPGSGEAWWGVAGDTLLETGVGGVELWEGGPGGGQRLNYKKKKKKSCFKKVDVEFISIRKEVLKY